ncbi:hypothetical protein [Halorussus caseinilyticus]|uniref:Major facilitator superfamily (MFS) profile domain-containing protein n=1 Tax=Halorussus caseinilyticus TaxID=3034025 RepID=A0ABD5WKR0_9EURY
MAGPRRRTARRLRHRRRGVLSGPSVLLLLASGLVGGVVTGYLAGGLTSGLGHGLLLGVVVVALGAGLGAWVLSSPDPQPYPGAGMALVLWWVVAGLLGAEAVVGGLVGGGLGRIRGR